MNFICFDLEGPLSPQDNAYELMKLTPNGDKVFEVISRYDDLLTMEGRKDYEPGDTLAFIVPFLMLHKVSEVDIATLATKATLTDGAAELVTSLGLKSWEVFCINTTYEQYARHIAQNLGIPASNVACTPFPLDKFTLTLCQEDTAQLEQIEQDILAMSSTADDSMIKRRLDDFFWRKLPKTDLGTSVKKVKPVGGRRKVAAIKRFSQSFDQSLSNWVVVGDSITDFKMLKAVNQAGGLAIAFNANQYALPYATMSLASTDINDLFVVLQEWQERGRDGVERMVKAREKAGGKENRDYFHWLADKSNINDIISLHKRLRQLVREEAGKLG